MMQQPSSGVVPPSMQQPPVDPNQQQPPAQYGQPQQPWMMMAPPPPQPQQPPYAPQMWPPQTPQQPGLAPPQPQAQPYPLAAAAAAAAAPAPAPTSPDEIRSLWIGDLQYWMDENYIFSCFAASGEVVSVKVIRNKQTNLSEGYGFVEFVNRAAAERTLATYNGTVMPQTEQAFRLNWASLGAGQRKQDDSADYTVFVGDLAAEVSDVMLQDAFRVHYSSVKGAKVITDHITGRSKGYGFVRFADEGEQQRAMTEMNGVVLSTRPMRTGPAANKKPAGVQQKASYQTTQGNPGENDPNNTTIFVGGLDPNVTDDQLRQVFSPYGELVHVKIPVGKGCGFVQFGSRAAAEQALAALNGAQIGSQSVRLSWGRSPSAKQVQPGQAQWNGAYGYGYPQGGYDAYGYAAAAPQDPNMYYANYAGYGNYQQTQQ
ncbi:polyadenylate-binding protein RBP45-like [Chenopodium quinoa]|uniref:polyadenylate-binding protein RBP45-like n=1 Tax=Chenopodium quinoa TaxID=63459 RepID=UPI000B77D4F6|nr:polyadenylate-binding protein RBP45-like [Chenopodium quinoa]